MPIRVLPDEIASQIAAGEVVERPASVVKELLENALDAGATHIQVRIEGAGQRLVEVSDNGSGIPAEQLSLAVTRHATSKLQSAEDLFRIQTLGFRGEALASIASVSQFTLISRPSDSPTAASLPVSGGVVGELHAVGAPSGTLVRVEDLFFNLPARRKFLKSDLTERRQIDELVTRYALAYPHVRFSLTQEGRPALQTSGNGERREVLAALHSLDIARQMLEVFAEEHDLRLTGYISPVSLTRPNRRELIFFVNGRPVHDVALATALVQAYHTLLMVGRYPLAALFLELPPEQVDVNVHPTKAEVRFRERERIFSFIQRSVRKALLAYSPAPGLDAAGLWKTYQQPAGHQPELPDWRAAPDWSALPEPTSPAGIDLLPTSSTPDQSPVDTPPAPVSGRAGLLRLVGQVAATYLIAEAPDGLYLIDQHAAHERVLFEKMLTQVGQLPSQVLLQVVTVEFPAAAMRLLETQLPVLSQLGFQVELFGRTAVLVRAVPGLLAHLDPAAALRVLVEDFEEDETPLQAEHEARLVARICKRAAVKGGQMLSIDEQQALLRDLQACRSPRTCPHGRPTMIHLSVDLLERQFGRRGAR